MGSVIRQRRETDYHGNFVAKPAAKRAPPGAPKTMVSAFDNEELYELTELGEQFVHYAMTELTSRIEYAYEAPPDIDAEAPRDGATDTP